MNKLVFLYNARSNKGLKDKELDSICNVSVSMGYDPRVIFSTSTENIEDTLFGDTTYDSGDLIISIGGDGTFHNLVRNTFNKDVTVSHLPHGTTNDIKRVLGLLNKNIEDDLRNILNGEEKYLDIPILNGTPFTYSAGCGKLLNIPYSVPARLKKTFGHLAYLSAGVNELVFNKVHQIPFYMETKKFNIEETAAIILITNQSRVAGFDNFIKDSVVDDGEFEVSILAAKDNIDVIKSIIKNLKSGLSNNKNYLKFHTNHVSFMFEYEPEFCIDGDKYDGNTRRVDINIGKTKVLVPLHRKPNQFKR
ncbi:MAG TPA: diacylglycerol kinase family protein [Bacilli bacterium]|nr:diacylglycerol kinase family protein [Bacilli bacterium]